MTPNEVTVTKPFGASAGTGYCEAGRPASCVVTWSVGLSTYCPLTAQPSVAKPTTNTHGSLLMVLPLIPIDVFGPMASRADFRTHDSAGAAAVRSGS